MPELLLTISLPKFRSSYKDLLRFHLLPKTFPYLPGEILSPSPVPMALLAFHWSSNQSLVKALAHMCLSSHETVNILGTESRSHYLVIIMPATWPELRKDSVNVIELLLWKNIHLGSRFLFSECCWEGRWLSQWLFFFFFKQRDHKPPLKPRKRCDWREMNRYL